MSSFSPQLGGMEGPSQLYSTADFGDADDMRPTAAYLDVVGNGTATPYTTAVGNILSRHIDEIKQKATAAVSLPTGWKRRLRDFLGAKNTDLLEFLNLNISSHATLSKGDAVLRKFAGSNYSPNHASVRDLVMDASGGTDLYAELNTALLDLRKGDALADFATALTYIFEQYRAAGDETLRHEQVLRTKLEALDKVQGRLVTVVDMDPSNEAYQPLLEATEAYVENIFKASNIEEAYLAFIKSYRRFAALRDVMTMTRTIQSNEHEPLCTICLQEAVQYTLSPCGHTFCNTCVKRQVSSCFICRTSIRDKVRLYFG